MRYSSTILVTSALLFSIPVHAHPAFDGTSDSSRYLRLHIGSDIFSNSPASASRYGYDFGLAYEYGLFSVVSAMLDAAVAIHSGRGASQLLVPTGKLMLNVHLLPGRHVWIPILSAGGGVADFNQSGLNDWGAVISGGGGIDYFPYADNLLGSYGMKLGLEAYYSRFLGTAMVDVSYLFLFVFAGSF